MPNLGGLLKDEIVRLARREIRSHVASLHKSSAGYRRDVAALKRRLSGLERQLRHMARRMVRTVPDSPVASAENLRFRADGFGTLRERLGISAENMGKLLGVSGQSVYAWETKRTAPRKSQLPAIAALRGLGKREVLQRLNGNVR